ncbi:MAG: tetratricopeptide repeat protein [Proteiniphilum sp.]
MNKENLYTFIEDPDALATSPADALKAVVDAYPYFHTSRLLYTKYLDMMNSDHYNEELSTTAVLCADRRKLFYLIYTENYHKLLVQPKEFSRDAKDRTEELLDSFLTSLGEREMHGTTVADGVLNVVSTDYLSYLRTVGEDATTEQTEDQKLQHHDIIDAFIEKAATDTLFTPDNSPTGEHDLKPANEEDGSEFLTETLAKIYIKQKKYEQALTIIKRLSLNFPKKSIYFADQIRFLEYLIMNERFR